MKAQLGIGYCLRFFAFRELPKRFHYQLPTHQFRQFAFLDSQLRIDPLLPLQSYCLCQSELGFILHLVLTERLLDARARAAIELCFKQPIALALMLPSIAR